MPAYAVVEPPRRNRSATEHSDRFVFIREKFSLGAFLFGPLWMIWRRLWFVLVLYLVAVGLIGYGLQRLDVAWSARAAVAGLIQLLVGLEATGLRRWTLVRRGWRDRGVVIADDLEAAERRFFDARPGRMGAPAAAAPINPLAGFPEGPLHPDVTGLFPEPGGGR
jgi:uncharacterized protein DUF2628